MWSAGRAPRRSVGGRPEALRFDFTLTPGMRVGLFGGSFNPAHQGHAHVAETALNRLGLDRVIWLVSPQNPLKRGQETASQAERVGAVKALARGPGMIVTDAETNLGSARVGSDKATILRIRVSRQANPREQRVGSASGAGRMELPDQ